MKRVYVDSPDEAAFIKEVLRSVESATDHEAKMQVLSRALMTMRGWCYAQAAVILGEGPPTREEGVVELFKAAAMYYPEGEWRRFGELLYPKEGPMMERLLEVAKNKTGPRKDTRNR